MAGRRSPLKYKLVKFADWYADSVYVQGFCVMTEDEYDDFDSLLAEVQKVIRKKNIRLRMSYGEGFLNYADVYELCEYMTILDITEQQARDIKNLLDVEFGWFPWDSLKDWLDYWGEEDRI